jgi:hypothetical protein
MKTRLTGLAFAAILVGCTSSSPRTIGTPGTAGTPGGAGAPGTGGTPGSAGTPGTGGTPGGAGTPGTAGTPGGAGTPGSAGTPGTGGTPGGAGAPGTAGTPGGAGSPGTGGTGTDAGPQADATTSTDGPNLVGDYKGRPLGGTPRMIPGTIQVEDYDTGGEGVAYHDASVTNHGQLCNITRTDVIDLNCTGQQGSPTDKNQDMGCMNETPGEEYLGYIATGDWLNYTVTVKEAGTYAISVHAGVAGNTKLQWTFTPTMKTDPITLANSSGCGVEAYHVWRTQSNLATIMLQPGTYVLRLDFVAATLNLDWFSFTKM